MSEATFPSSIIPGYVNSHPGIQVATQMREDPSEEDFQFINQMGVEWAMTSVADPANHTAEYYTQMREKYEAHGVKIYRLANHGCHNVEEITLGLPGRDEKIAEYLQYIRNMGAAGIHYSTYAHMANGIELGANDHAHWHQCAHVRPERRKIGLVDQKGIQGRANPRTQVY